MKLPTYNDIFIGSLDQAYIDRIAEATGVDETEAPLYSLGSDRPCIANDIIRYIIEQSISNLNISDKSKDILYYRVYCNCLDSGFINTDLDDFPKREHKKIRELMEIF